MHQRQTQKWISNLFIICLGGPAALLLLHTYLSQRPGLLLLQHPSVSFEEPQKASDLLKISGRVGKLGNETQLWHFNPVGSFRLLQIGAVQDRKQHVDSSPMEKGDKTQRFSQKCILMLFLTGVDGNI